MGFVASRLELAKTDRATESRRSDQIAEEDRQLPPFRILTGPAGRIREGHAPRSMSTPSFVFITSVPPLLR